jgi:hypothetical protein
MAKYDPDRIAETAEPYAAGTSGIEPLCDEFGRLVLAPGSGGGGSDATLAEQQVQSGLLTMLANASDVPTSDVVAAIEALGATATIADVVGLLTTDATAQSNILAKLTDIEIDTTASAASLLAIESDADATRVATESIAAELSQAATGFVSVRLSNGTAFVAPFTSGDAVAQSGTWNITNISGTISLPTGASTETTLSALNGKIAAAGTHSDGAAQASTTQVRVLLTGINPAAWGGAGTLSAPATNAAGVAVQGYLANGASVGSVVRPLPIFWDGTNQRFGLTDTSGRHVIVGAAASGAAVTGNPVLGGGSDGTNARNFEMKASNPLAADYGLKTREIPLQKSSVKTTAGTPAASLVVRAGPCWLFDVFISNQTVTACYLTVYDATSAPSRGASATARKIVGRHIDTKAGADPFNFFEDFDGMYFSTGCVLVVEMSEDAATVDTSGAPTLAMNATFVAGT